MTEPGAGELPVSVGIFGLGLIGGSLARDLLARGVRVLGYDTNRATLGTAELDGVTALRGLDAAALASLDLAVLAVPATAAPTLLRELVPFLPESCVLSDVGSTKSSILAAAESLGVADRFVGAHPMAGDHRSGWEASRTGIFAGARVYLSFAPTVRSEAVTLVRELWARLGARIEEIDPTEHDRRLAWISHLPQITSSAFGASLARREWTLDHLGPGGRDVARLAGSSPEMWAAITVDNASEIERALDDLVARLQDLRAAIARRDQEAIHGFFREGHEWFWGGKVIGHGSSVVGRSDSEFPVGSQDPRTDDRRPTTDDRRPMTDDR